MLLSFIADDPEHGGIKRLRNFGNTFYTDSTDSSRMLHPHNTSLANNRIIIIRINSTAVLLIEIIVLILSG
jgi:hypothetical protein